MLLITGEPIKQGTPRIVGLFIYLLPQFNGILERKPKGSLRFLIIVIMPPSF